MFSDFDDAMQKVAEAMEKLGKAVAEVACIEPDDDIRGPHCRRQNLRAFQNIPCGYKAPLPRRNNRVMIRRTC